MKAKAPRLKIKPRILHGAPVNKPGSYYPVLCMTKRMPKAANRNPNCYKIINNGYLQLMTAKHAPDKSCPAAVMDRGIFFSGKQFKKK